ncbi:uncharacterized protein LOC123524123 [Mercenaria mercenaria]|uniref:uncharacterized protein LOC123524123 n=1 Tax=Mercenaria mercenaria TaxID=6596 RepID=UPI00234F7EEF|nr:uncharacterized protein LOC123524123 [Mercenaria mercenaria]
MADENGKDSSLDRRSSIAESSDSYDSYFTAETSIPSATIFSETISSIRTEESTNVQELIQTALGEIQPDAYIDFNSSFTLFDGIASITGKASNDVKAEVIEVLKTHRKQFQIILKLFNKDENTSTASMNEKEQLRLEREAYDHLITQCNDIDSLEKKYIFPVIFAAATIINVPIYIFCEADYAKFTWQFFPPRFEFPDQPQPPIVSYMTIYMSPDGKFSQITIENVPKSNGILGYFLETLEATAACDIDLPKQLLNISKDKKDEMIRRGSKTSLRQACNLLGNTLRLDSAGIGDSNNDKNGDDIMEHLLLHNSEEDFLLYCKILIKSSDFKALEVGISDWDAFVAECEYTRRFMTLSELDQVVVERNIEVGRLVRACKEGGEELDKRRKTVNRTVIASSTVGLIWRWTCNYRSCAGSL